MPDLQLITIHLEDGIEKDLLPGLVTLTPPKRTARGRENDMLVALTCLNGADNANAQKVNAWLQKSVDRYFQTAGTVTFALKNMVEALNNDLMDRNLKEVKNGSRLTADLNLIVLRRDSLFVFNIGKARSWVCSDNETVEYSDSENQGRGLGINQMLICRFSTRDVKQNDLIIVSCQPPEVWKPETFSGCSALSNDAVGRRLLNQIGPDLKAVLLRIVPGKGMITQAPLNHRPAQAETPEAGKTPEAQPEKPAVSPINKEATASSQSEPVVQTKPASSGQEDNKTVFSKPEGSAHSGPAQVSGQKPVSTAPSEPQKSNGKHTAEADMDEQENGSFLTSLLQKVFPGMAEESLKLSRSTLIGIALAVPVLIVLIAGSVYVKVGKSREFAQNLIMAQEYAIQAEVVAYDEPMRLASLQQSMFWLDKAETYGQSEESSSLRVNVQGALDEIQGIHRLEMIEAVPGGLKAGSNISQIVANSTELYLLDDKSGTVKRYSMESSGYEPDESFDCGPNPDNPLNTLGPLVDIVPVNKNNSFKATILAIDASGNIEYCIPGESGVTSSLTFPDQGWMGLRSIAIDGSYLYVLDGPANAVYRYVGDGIQFDSKPTLFFDNQIPTLSDAIDIEVNGDELYILRNNGQLLECTYSHLKDYKLTECIDPAPYGDMRTGQEPEPISFPESNFIQMRMTAAPDSSFYLLDSSAKALYHFSLQRNLQKILHPRDLSGVDLDRLTPTAFAISSGRIAFMAFGNQIYYAALP